ncbi:hypothetical protein POVCU2_0049210 [Plasmodium ovale curtisi]|uniref:Uncharacterized protein n=1 Tax=Plasmodium ovale curtisi TaxID=864141 RepID=A0A1A8WBI6_PLAOA|nr:hypothetical protein POVCU2_0049210 [Plasmodium ovale curtisi]SBS98364.1 hypothetical protein POVCU1_045570 [Plasmodium ovale curtisi]
MKENSYSEIEGDKRRAKTGDKKQINWIEVQSRVYIGASFKGENVTEEIRGRLGGSTSTKQNMRSRGCYL